MAAVQELQASGIRSIDVGCLQVNLMHHPAAFISLEQAFDPGANARYAARFLDALHDRSQDSTQAIGDYHSQTPTLGAAYRNRVLARWQPLGLADSGYAAFARREVAYGISDITRRPMPTSRRRRLSSRKREAGPADQPTALDRSVGAL